MAQTQQQNGPTPSTMVLSTPIMNPYHRDLLALKQDYAHTQAQLKLTQQTLQQTYQDMMLAQEQKRKAESDAVQLRAQWDNVVKKHLDHLPERHLLVQQVAELKAELEKEQHLRLTLQREQGAHIQEILKLKADLHSLKAATGNTSSSSSSITTTTTFATSSTRRSSSSSSGGGGGGVVGFFFSRQSSSASSHPTVPSPVSPLSPLVSSSSPPPLSNAAARILPPTTKHAPQHISSGSTVAPSTLSPTSGHESSSSPWSDGSSSSTTARTSFSTASSISHEESSEYLEAEKVYYEQLRQENATLATTVQELRDKLVREQESIKSYMSLFESLQQKQANALTLAQAELELLRADQTSSQARLEARSSLVHAFAATVNAQAVEIERLTLEAGRHQAARAQVEQELSLLLEASLSVLERCLEHVHHGRQQLIEQGLAPMRQTVLCLEVPSITADWEACERAIEQCWRGLEQALVEMQKEQEIGLQSREDSSKKGPVSSAISGHDQQQEARAVKRGEDKSQTTSLSESHNAVSQEVVMARKMMADTYLEDCVLSVEQLAREKRILQELVVDLRRGKATMDEEALVEKLAQKQASEETEEDLEQAWEHVDVRMSQQEDRCEAKEKSEVEEGEKEDGAEDENVDKVEADATVLPENTDISVREQPSNDQILPTTVHNISTTEHQCEPEQTEVSMSQETRRQIRSAYERIARLESLLGLILAWIESIDMSQLKKAISLQHQQQQNRSESDAITTIKEEDILALGIQDVPCHSSRSLNSKGSVDHTSEVLDETSSSMTTTETWMQTLQRLITNIRQELGASSQCETAITTERNSSPEPPLSSSDISSADAESNGNQLDDACLHRDEEDAKDKQTTPPPTEEPNCCEHLATSFYETHQQTYHCPQQPHLPREAQKGQSKQQSVATHDRNHSGSSFIQRLFSFTRNTNDTSDSDCSSDMEENEEDAEDNIKGSLIVSLVQQRLQKPIPKTCPWLTSGHAIMTPLSIAGTGPGGALVDVDAFCHEFAFRSFLKQHRWLKTQQQRQEQPK
ncbi:hypothetical protein BGW41_003757 [Actinomortierella wolfii]|nr:hypothetical protein BGW41_003757 [Actinomortierella wolfii]